MEFVTTMSSSRWSKSGSNRSTSLLLSATVDVDSRQSASYNEPVYAAEHAKETPDKPAIVMEPSGRTITYGEFEPANRFASGCSRGFSKGDHIAVLLENNIRFLEIACGWSASVSITPVNSFPDRR